MGAPRGRDTKGTDLYPAQASLRSLPFRPPMIVEARIREQAGDAGAPARCGQPLPAWGPAVLQPDRAPLAPCCSPLFPSPLPPFQGSRSFHFLSTHCFSAALGYKGYMFLRASVRARRILSWPHFAEEKSGIQRWEAIFLRSQCEGEMKTQAPSFDTRPGTFPAPVGLLAESDPSWPGTWREDRARACSLLLVQSSSPPQVPSRTWAWQVAPHSPRLFPSHVAEAICLSDPWLLQALHGPQLPPQAREGPFSQRAAGA